MAAPFFRIICRHFFLSERKSAAAAFWAFFGLRQCLHAGFERWLREGRAATAQVLQIQAAQLLAQPRPEHLNWVEIWRKPWYLKKLDPVLLVVRLGRRRGEERLDVTQQTPQPTLLLWLQLLGGLAEFARLQRS